MCRVLIYGKPAIQIQAIISLSTVIVFISTKPKYSKILKMLMTIINQTKANTDPIGQIVKNKTTVTI